MSRSFVSFSALVLLGVAHAAAATADSTAPPHAKICAGNGIVSKHALSDAILAVNDDARHATSFGPGLWRTIFTDGDFCKRIPECASNPAGDACAKAAAKCRDYQTEAITSAESVFESFNVEFSKPNGAGAYLDKANLVGQSKGNSEREVALYFASASEAAFPIACNKDPKHDIPAPPVAFNPDKDPVAKNFRLRGVSDDLDYAHAEPGYKGTTPATLNFQGDTSAIHTSSAKFNAAFGYGFDAGIGNTGQLVPYVSVYQSLSDTALKPRTIDPNNNLAGGVLFEQRFYGPWLSNVFSIKPQYLFDTATEAQLVSARAIYWPHVTALGLNDFTQLADGLPWGKIVFNLRSDSGDYLDRGNMPVMFISNRNFERAGGQIGFALTTDGLPTWPSMSLVVTETYVHGFSGFYRTVDQQAATFTYNVGNTFLGLTAAYKHGRDEDTGVNAQSWQVGLSAHY